MMAKINFKVTKKELYLTELALNCYRTFFPKLTKKEKDILYNLIRKIRRKRKE